jgi:hypothetical protein
MCTRMRIGLAGLLGAALMCIAVAGASASRMQVTNYEFPFEMA